MADFRINVIIDPSSAKRGGRQVEQSLNRVNNAADRTRRVITRAVSLTAIALGIRQLVQLSDTFTNLQNRLRIVTQDTAQLAVVTEDLFKVANATRTSFAGTAELFTRVSLATKDLAVSQNQLIRFTKSVNQAIILSGASAREANAGLIQLSQGLASARLGGDELRSVLEQLPKVADVIAKGMGVTRGELRLLGSQGKITAEVILDAFIKAEDELEELFRSTIPTIGQAFQVLKNNFIELLGAFNKATGIARGLSTILLATADNLETLARVALAAGIALGVHFAVRGVGAAITAVRVLGAVILANPLGALVTALVIVTSLLVVFADKITIGAGRVATLEDFAVAAFEAIGRAMDTVINFFEDNFGVIAEVARNIFKDVEFSIAGVLVVTARIIDAEVGLFRGAFRAIVIIFKNLPAVLERIFVDSFNLTLRSLTVFVNEITKAINFLREKTGLNPTEMLEAFQLEASAKAEFIGGRISQALADGINGETSARDALDNILNRAEQLAQERIARQNAAQALADTARAALDAIRSTKDRPDKVFEDLLGNIRDENQLLRLNTRERFLLTAQLDAEKKLKRDLTAVEKERLSLVTQLNFGLQAERDILDEITGPLEEYEIGLDAINRLLKTNRITTEEAAAAAKDLRIELLGANLQDVLDDLDRENQLLQLNTKQRFLLTAQLDAEARLKRDLTITERERLALSVELNFELQAEREVLNEIQGPLEQYETKLKAINSLLRMNKITTGEATAAIRDLRIELLEAETSLEAGFERGLLKVGKNIEDFSILSEQLVTNAFQGAEDALVKFVTTGKLSFKDLANSIIEDIARIAIRQAISSAVSSAFGGFSFGFSKGGEVVKAATGGLIRGPGTKTSDNIPSLLSPGEFVTNATSTDRFLPLLQAINDFKGGSSAKSAGGTGGGGGNVSVVIVDQRSSDAPPVEQRQTTGADGSRQITLVIRDTLRRQIVAGEHDKAFQQRFDLKPALAR